MGLVVRFGFCICTVQRKGRRRETAAVRICAQAVFGWGCVCPLGEGKLLFFGPGPLKFATSARNDDVDLSVRGMIAVFFWGWCG